MAIDNLSILNNHVRYWKESGHEIIWLKNDSLTEIFKTYLYLNFIPEIELAIIIFDPLFVSLPFYKRIKRAVYIPDKILLSNKKYINYLINTLIKIFYRTGDVLIDNAAERKNILTLFPNSNIKVLEKGYDVNQKKKYVNKNTIVFMADTSDSVKRALNIISLIQRRHIDQKIAIVGKSINKFNKMIKEYKKDKELKILTSKYILDSINKAQGLVVMDKIIDPGSLIETIANGSIVFVADSIEEIDEFKFNKIIITLPDNEYMAADKITKFMEDKLNTVKYFKDTRKILLKYSWDEVAKRSLSYLESL
ncbi:MAG: hypothetical protein UT08_C0001G0049 [Candidatus Woesebacteria bacterium GW2011_GWB1_38_8]|uniref:Glycosyl transferase family 1 domain-containing protein n=1 Tax=Candidatus Woesebacteria bacterium GW2011_GWB1_38_8 TaxID=1618570 RepID=A0A0G0L2J4_9BACT|nr:MAG: hypothetical protein UT08_C0001G0049 [Candidatus Woesebacteria bacterium GW2011_GWB1_38_8]